MKLIIKRWSNYSSCGKYMYCAVVDFEYVLRLYCVYRYESITWLCMMDILHKVAAIYCEFGMYHRYRWSAYPSVAVGAVYTL
jgi:hypothetical protein